MLSRQSFASVGSSGTGPRLSCHGSSGRASLELRRWKLATLLAAPLIKGEAGVASAQRAQQMFEFMLQQAAGYDAVKTRERRLEDTTMAEWDRSRGESYDYNEWENYR